ncbi:MAG: hypothetical protein AAFU57_04350 [Bacteroidota bacterium]
MKNLLILAIFFGTLSINAQETIEGLWNTGKENTIVEIKKNNDSYEGVIVSSENSKAPVGKKLIKDVVETNEGYTGKLYAAKKDKWMDANFVVKEEILVLEVGSGLRKKSIEWEKAK